MLFVLVYQMLFVVAGKKPMLGIYIRKIHTMLTKFVKPLNALCNTSYQCITVTSYLCCMAIGSGYEVAVYSCVRIELLNVLHSLLM